MSTPVHNPELPPELLDQPEDVVHGDQIGGTMFSKHWVFTTLMKLIEVVDNSGPDKQENGSESETETVIDLDDKLQDELCKLWDMSMNQEVAIFLQEFKAKEILCGVIAASRAPRATEISVGILGNMACCSKVCEDMATSAKLIEYVVALLGSPDSPTLVETTRLINTSLSCNEARQPWLKHMKKGTTVYDNVKFILQSSTNEDLLIHSVNLVDTAMDSDDELCASWATQDMLQALFETLKQLGVKMGETLDTTVHIIQLFSTTDTGMAALVADSDRVTDLMEQYLGLLCEDEVLVLNCKESTIAAVVSVLKAVCSSCNKAHSKLLEDCEIIRCVLKILVAVYQKIYKVKYKSIRRSRSQSKSGSKPSPERNIETDVPSTSDVTKENQQTHSIEHTEKHEQDQTDKTQRHDSLVEEEEKVLYTILHENLQGLLVDLVILIHKATVNDEDPPILNYIDHCPRERVHCLVESLKTSDSEEHTLSLLNDLAEKHNLKKLLSIITDCQEKE